MTEARSSRGAAQREDAGVDAAEVRVTRARVALSASLRDASLEGRETVERAVSAVRPLLIGVGILAGAVVVVQWWRGTRQTRGRRLPAPLATTRQRPNLARSLAFALATAAARHLAERWFGPQARRPLRRGDA